MCLALAAGVPLLCFGQLNKTRGDAPGGVPQATYFIHRLGTDHAEGITTMDMNGDGKPDLLSGAYWYENPGPQGGEWTGINSARSILSVNLFPIAANGRST